MTTSTPKPRIVPARWSEAEQELIPALLWRVYVEGGYTPPERAKVLFALPALRERGLLLLAWQGEQLVGTVIVASAASPARQVARADEAEIHLLAVDPDCRRSGLGAALMHAASEQATRMGFARLVLSTQSSMAAAHHLYEDLGYRRNPARNWHHGSREFHVYEKQYIQQEQG